MKLDSLDMEKNSIYMNFIYVGLKWVIFLVVFAFLFFWWWARGDIVITGNELFG